MDFDPESNIVEVYMYQLRKKIDKGYDIPLIRTIVGAGYMLKGNKSSPCKIFYIFILQESPVSLRCLIWPGVPRIFIGINILLVSQRKERPGKALLISWKDGRVLYYRKQK